MDRTRIVEVGGKKHLVELLYPVDLELSEWSGLFKEEKDSKLVIAGNEHI